MKKHGIHALALASFEHGLAEQTVFLGGVTGETIFQAASLSKPVFAAAVLRSGFDLDRPLVDYMGGVYRHEQPRNKVFDEVSDPRVRNITARMVLSHRTGFPNWAYEKPLAFLRDPGTDWGYSGEGYTMLQRAVERATGLTLDGFVGRHVFSHFEMTASAYDPDRVPSAKISPGYNAQGQPASNRIQANAAGSLLTSLGDYVRFLRMALNERLPAAMYDPIVMAHEGSGVRWGLGWGLPKDGATDYFFHWGSNLGYKSFVIGRRDTGSGFVYFTNSDNGLKILPGLMSALLGRQLPLLRFPMLGLS
jgi:CubicO group peptidase (beta-lactamase class C family)